MADDPITIAHRLDTGRIPKTLAGARLGVRVAPFGDSRGKDPRAVMDKINLAGSLPRGSYVADEPVAAILARAVSEALAAAGAPPAAPGAGLVLSGTLTRLHFQVTMGFAKCLLKGEISLDFTLSDSAGKTLATFALTGNGRAADGDIAPAAFASAVLDLVQKLAAEPRLVESLMG